MTTVCYQSVRYRKLNGTCDARSEWTNGRVSLSAAFGEFSLFNNLLIYKDSVKFNLSFKDLCHFMNVSLLAVFFLLYFQSQSLTVARKYRSPRLLNGLKKTLLSLLVIFLMLRYLWITFCFVFLRCWSAFLYVDKFRQNHHVGNVDTTVWLFAKWLYVLSDS